MGNLNCYKNFQQQEEIIINNEYEEDCSISELYSTYQCKMMYELKSIFETILNNQESSIKQVRILWRELDDTGCYLLAKALNHLPELQELTLKNNLLDSNRFKKFKASLLPSQQLKKLSITQNNLAEEGAISLAEILKECPNLEELILEDNNISDVGAQELAISIKNLIRLRMLWIHKNNITRDGLMSLANALNKIQSFQEFHFDTNLIDNTTLSNIANQVHKIVPQI